MSNERIIERDRIMAELGLLFGPLRSVVNGETCKDDLPLIEARLRRDLNVFNNRLSKYCELPHGIHYAREQWAAQHNVELLCDDILTHFRGWAPVSPPVAPDAEPIQDLKQAFEDRFNNALAALRAIPCDQPEGILSTDTPFKTYNTLRSIFSTAGRRVDLFDPYLEANTFHLYLSEVSPTALINLITSSDIMNPAKSGEARRDRIAAISKIFAAERPTSYRFGVVTGTKAQHDRHLRADDKLYHLGGSVHDATKARPFTLTKLQPIAVGELDAIISAAVMWFEPGMKPEEHRTS